MKGKDTSQRAAQYDKMMFSVFKLRVLKHFSHLEGMQLPFYIDEGFPAIYLGK